MMEELKEHSATGTETGRETHHREKHLYGRGHPGFFAEKTVNRNEYTNNSDAMTAYWKEWKNLELRKVGNGKHYANGQMSVRKHVIVVKRFTLFGLMVEKGIRFPRR